MMIKNAATLAVAGLLLSAAGPAEAANIKHKKAAATHTVYGIVVNSHSKPVSGASVHVMHHHKHAKAAAIAKPKAVKPKVTRAGAHHGIVTAANGTFNLKHHKTGTIEVVAHKKNEGSGHARVAVGKQTANLTVRLHKHHHHHS